MGFITTYSGHRIDPLEPNVKSIDIRDVAHALSLTCRGNGHVKYFFSVGQHCVMCAKEAAARGYSRRVVLGCLLHDAGEAYMSDVPRPFKVVLKEYVEAEDRLLDLIYSKYLGTTLDAKEKALVSEVDDAVLYYDMLELFGKKMEMEAPKLAAKVEYSLRAFEEVEKEYLELFEEWI